MIDVLKNKIWLTAKIRMVAESRRKMLSRILWVLMVWYSFSSLVVHLFSNSIKDLNPAEFGALFSVLSLMAPLVSLGLGLDILADKFRDCYLRLQKLLDHPSPDDELARQYSDILDIHPNHSPADYQDFLVGNITIEKKPLTDAVGNKIEVTWWMVTSYIIRKMAFWSLSFALFAFPVVYLITPFFSH
ncbi:MAG: SLATT domain-containing protein [Candidatus Liberibacter ctenarytainae]|uniref:SLATT domain-containing protein n=1 Tax=Candidatus Liberibacter ctenarytainae TaxID=2020335 RepID=A0A937AK19_9HYPH|nr:SLATT domain-containing protein [Candidatus Liberibacter ctenarytainae]